MPARSVIESRTGRWWALAVALAAVGAAIDVPLRLALGLAPRGWLAALDLAASLVIGIEFVRHAVLLRRVAAGPADAARAASVARLRTELVLDGVALAPGLLVALAAYPPAAPLAGTLAPFALLRLLFLHRAWRFAEGFAEYGHVHPGVQRLLKFLFWLALLLHWIACGWLALRAPEEFVKPVPPYVEAAYWALTTVATIGYGDVTPNGTAQVLYTMLVMLIGVGVFSFAIGSVAGLLATLDAAQIEHRQKMEKVHAFLEYHGLPAALRARVLAYHRHVHESRVAWGEDRLLQELPRGLQEDVALFLHRHILEQLPFLRGASEALLRDLALALHPLVCTPGEVLFRQGSEGSAMYFVDAGEIEILGADGGLLTRLGPGSFFGEVALLGARTRNATARAASHARLFSLEQDAFDNVLQHHPAFAAEVRRHAAARRAANGTPGARPPGD